MFESLRTVSDKQILANTDTIIAQDRKLTLRLLLHLHEIERRKLHLKRGYSSMFVYCTSHLKLSEPAAARRLRTARCLARFPELYTLLESGDLNLSTVSMVAKYLKPANAADILARIRGRSRRDVERFIAELEPLAVLPPDRVRTVVVPVAPPTATTASPPFTVAGDSEKSPSVGNTGPATDEPVTAPTTRQVERRALIQFSAGEEFLALVERVRSIASHRLPPNATFEQVFALVMSEYMNREDPQARHQRREAKKATVEIGPATPSSPRQIPAGVRDEVFARDRGCCAFVGVNGQRCGSVRHLQIDHINPVARGGGATIENLRLLCAHHNRLEAERLIGRSKSTAVSQSPLSLGQDFSRRV